MIRCVSRNEVLIIVTAELYFLQKNNIFLAFNNKNKSVFLYKWLNLHLFTNRSTQAGCDTRSIFKRSLTDLHSEFSFSWSGCLKKAESPNLLSYLPVAGGRIKGFIPFQRLLVLFEMQSNSCRIWTRVAESIFHGDKHYTTVASYKRFSSYSEFFPTNVVNSSENSTPLV